MSLDSAQLDEYLAFAIDLGKKAGEMIKDGQAKRFANKSSLDTKQNSIDLVTEVDQAVEAFISNAIKEKYPSHKFIGEETYAETHEMELTDEWTWINDPIDGTSPIPSPLVGCSIGLVYKKQPVVGVINMPFLNQIYSAKKGGGAWMNETARLPLTGTAQPLTELKAAMIASEWGSDRREETIKPKANSFSKLASQEGVMAHAIRVTGATTVTLVQVAAGQLDLYWDAGPYAWDVAAGMVIVTEAGGYFTGGKASFDRGTDDLGKIMMSRRYCCIRGVPATDSESSEQIQKRIVKDLYNVVEEWTNDTMEAENL
ncbi:hypothetical protein FFLO_04824 [Filobasidium floriforme]|uniref:Inositol-1-monophosphatase n=1 Tax=Filobasidium floriforme TaxID=5210 RepID=A0A8K0JIM8_9TREE|nr:hypothetical protein FFLO_04824 [Filobasidium floriforme]